MSNVNKKINRIKRLKKRANMNKNKVKKVVTNYNKDNKKVAMTKYDIKCFNEEEIKELRELNTAFETETELDEFICKIKNKFNESYGDYMKTFKERSESEVSYIWRVGSQAFNDLIMFNDYLGGIDELTNAESNMEYPIMDKELFFRSLYYELGSKLSEYKELYPFKVIKEEYEGLLKRCTFSIFNLISGREYYKYID